MESRLKLLRQETKAFKNELGDLKDTVSDQNKTIIHMLNEQQRELRTILTATRKNIKKTKGMIKDFGSLFPIATQAGLDQVESVINDYNVDEMAMTIRKVLFPGGLRKNLVDLLSMEMIMQYNIDGLQKKRLKDYTKFLNAVYNSYIDRSLSYSDFLKEFRHAIKLIKNKHYKTISVNRNKLRQLNDTTKQIKDEDASCDSNMS